MENQKSQVLVDVLYFYLFIYLFIYFFMDLPDEKLKKFFIVTKFFIFLIIIFRGLILDRSGTLNKSFFQSHMEMVLYIYLEKS